MIKSYFGFLFVLLLVFITLKLIEIGVVAAWSWWVVLLPLWAILLSIPAAILIPLFFVGFVTWVADRFL